MNEDMGFGGKMGRFKKIFVTLLSLVLLAGMGIALRQSMHSSLFILKKVEIQKPFVAPLAISITEEDILQLANAPLGQASIFDVDIEKIETRLLSLFWIKKVHLLRKLPQTLSIRIEFKKPKALFQNAKGKLSYVVQDGEVFGSAADGMLMDLPLLAGFSASDTFHINGALHIISRWESSQIGELATLSTVHWDSEKGYRILISYLKEDSEIHLSPQLDSRIRAIVDIGHEIDASFESKLLRLSSVIRYLSGNSIAARQIWADMGKKIVVKIAQDS